MLQIAKTTTKFTTCGEYVEKAVTYIIKRNDVTKGKIIEYTGHKGKTFFDTYEYKNNKYNRIVKNFKIQRTFSMSAAQALLD